MALQPPNGYRGRMWLYASVLFRDKSERIHRLRQVRWNEHLFLLTGKSSNGVRFTGLLEREYGKHFGPLTRYANAVSVEMNAEAIARAFEDTYGEPMPIETAKKESESNRRAWTTPARVVDCLEFVLRAIDDGYLTEQGFFMSPDFESKYAVRECALGVAGLLADVRDAVSELDFSKACIAIASDDDLDGTAIVRRVRKGPEPDSSAPSKSCKRLTLVRPSEKELGRLSLEHWPELRDVEIEVGPRRFEGVAVPLARLLEPDQTPALERLEVTDVCDHVHNKAFARFLRVNAPALARVRLFPEVEKSLCKGNWLDLHVLAQLVLHESGQPVRALEILEFMRHANPSEPGPLTDVAIALEHLGQGHRAVEALELALEIDPADEASRYNLANLLCKMGQLDAALDHIEIVVNATPADPAACHVKAKILDRLEDRRARTWYRRALDLYRAQARADGDDPATLLQIACVHAGLGEDDDAMAALAMAMAIDPAQAVHAQSDGDLERLRRDPRFLELLAPD